MVAEVQEPTKAQNPYWLWLEENTDTMAKEAGTGRGSVASKLAGVSLELDSGLCQPHAAE